MRSILWCTAILTALVAQPAAQAGGSGQRPTFTSGVSLVSIGAVARDARNRMVRDLTRHDFEVLEDGAPQPIVDFKVTDQGPISVALLFDVSGSMSVASSLQAGREVADHLMAWMTPGTDEVGLFTFDKTIREEIAFTGDFDAVRGALGRIEPYGLTSLYDGIAETASILSKRPAPRRAIVVITDGIDTSSVLTAPQVSGLASSIDVPVYLIAVVSPVDHPDNGAAAAARHTNLSNLVHWTGGTLVFVSAPAQVNVAVRDLITELRLQYLLAIEASSEAGWRRLEVRAKRRGLVVRARSGYFAG